MRSPLVLSLVAGVAIGQLGWIDALFIPLVLAGPLATGAVAAARHVALRWIALTWLAAGITMLVGDEIVNHEDVLFHGVLSVVMAGLAAAGWSTVVLLTRGKRRVETA